MNYVQSLLRNSASKTIKWTVYSAERERERKREKRNKTLSLHKYPSEVKESTLLGKKKRKKFVASRSVYQ